MTAPLIGVTSSYLPSQDGAFGTIQVGESYIQAVLHAGGLPVVIPVGLPDSDLLNVFSRVDGILFTGGADIDPKLFNGLPHPRVYDVDARRDSLEIGLVKLAAENKKPFLGICRGIQVINVALGGTLFTHIPDQLSDALRHDYYPNVPRNHLAHPVRLSSESRLAQILGGDMFEVNSLHHQGLEQIAPTLRAVGSAPDQLVEAVELPNHPFGLGVQWHPEWLQEHAPQRKLFQAFIQAAQNAAL